METKDWYKLTFLIESDSEEIIIWKLNELANKLLDTIIEVDGITNANPVTL